MTSAIPPVRFSGLTLAACQKTTQGQDRPTLSITATLVKTRANIPQGKITIQALKGKQYTLDTNNPDVAEVTDKVLQMCRDNMSRDEIVQYVNQQQGRLLNV